MLKISNTAVTILPDFLGELPLLDTIEIIDCDIKAIPDSIQRLIDSEVLTLVRTALEARGYGLVSYLRRKKRRRGSGIT
jgi:hypothetical protein